MSFRRAFQRSLVTAGKIFGEGCVWKFADVPRAAITIGMLSAQQRAMYGGRFIDAHLSVSVTAELWAAALTDGADEDGGSVLRVSGPDLPETEVRIGTVERPGNGSVVLICGPAGISTPRR